MLTSNPIDSTRVYIADKKLITTNDDSLESKQSNYLTQLKEKVFDEIIERIEKNMDVNAADILDAARIRLKQLSADSRISLIVLKPICLLFLFELYLELPGKI